MHHAGPHTRMRRCGRARDSGRDVAGQAVGRVVGNAYGVVFVVVGNDREHRAEDLLARDRHVVRDVREHRRFDVVALLSRPCGRPVPPAASVAPSSMPAWMSPGSCSTAPRTRRARSTPSVARVADLVRCGNRPRSRRLRPCESSVRASATGIAGLARIVEHVTGAAATALCEVGVVEHDVGRLAAEFLRHALDGGRGGLGDEHARARVEPVNDTIAMSGMRGKRRNRRRARRR